MCWSKHRKKSNSDWSIYLCSNGTDVEYKIDTGAQVNILTKNIFNKLKVKPTLKPSKVKLTAYNGLSIPVLGKCILKIINKASMSHVLFIVADTNSPPILGLNTSEKLGLIKRIMEVDVKDVPDDLLQFSDCFGDIGTLPQTHHIELKPDVTPVIHPPRRIPYALKPQLREEINRMEKLGIIERVTEPTDW